jgi:GAF domain-containing protein
VPLLLAAIGENIHWDFGGLWRADERGQHFSCSHVWQRHPECGSYLAAESRTKIFARHEGMVGTIAATAQPMWIEDISRDATFRRVTKVGKNQLHTACAVPVFRAKKVIAVLEFLSRDQRDYDAELLDLCENLGAQIASVLPTS